MEPSLARSFSKYGIFTRLITVLFNDYVANVTLTITDTFFLNVLFILFLHSLTGGITVLRTAILLSFN